MQFQNWQGPYISLGKNYGRWTNPNLQICSMVPSKTESSDVFLAFRVIYLKYVYTNSTSKNSQYYELSWNNLSEIFLRVWHISILGANNKGLPSDPNLTGSFFLNVFLPSFVICAKANVTMNRRATTRDTWFAMILQGSKRTIINKWNNISINFCQFYNLTVFKSAVDWNSMPNRIMLNDCRTFLTMGAV